MPKEDNVRRFPLMVLIGLLIGTAGCSSLTVHGTDSRGKRLAKGVGRAVIAVPTFGLSEVYYAARQD